MTVSISSLLIVRINHVKVYLLFVKGSRGPVLCQGLPFSSIPDGGGTEEESGGFAWGARVNPRIMLNIPKKDAIVLIFSRV
jgi:hypothetical protein